jgi:hypothetical protein
MRIVGQVNVMSWLRPRNVITTSWRTWRVEFQNKSGFFGSQHNRVGVVDTRRVSIFREKNGGRNFQPFVLSNRDTCGSIKRA